MWTSEEIIFKVLPYTIGNIINPLQDIFQASIFWIIAIYWVHTIKSSKEYVYAKQLTLGISLEWDICLVAEKKITQQRLQAPG